MSKETQRDVTEAAKSLAKNLKIRGLGHLLTIEVGEAWDTDTEGSAIQVASLGREYPVIEIWYDKWFDDVNLNYWVGFTSENVKKVENLYKKLIESKTSNVADYFVDDHLGTHVEVGGFHTYSYIEDSDAICWFGVYTNSLSVFNIDKFSNFIEFVLDTLPEFAGKIYREGPCKQVTTNRYERSPGARNDCIERFGYNCQVCDMNFRDDYGEIGNDFIHVHHKEELSKSGERETAPEFDLVPVCPNCHAMLHRGDKLLTVEELRAIWKKHHP